MEINISSDEEDFDVKLETADEIDPYIRDLTLDDCYDMGEAFGIVGGDMRGHKDVQLALKIYFLKQVGGMEVQGREPFQVLKNIQEQHREKCKMLIGLFTDMKKRLSEEKWKDLVADLEQTVIGFQFPKSLDDHITRLSGDEYCRIMVTGELCSGKTTLINSLLGENVLPSSPLSNTITVCEIRHAHQRYARAIPWQNIPNKLLATVVLVEDETANVFTEDDYEFICTFTMKKKEECEMVVKLRLEVTTEKNNISGDYNEECSAITSYEEHNEKLGEFGRQANFVIRRHQSKLTGGGVGVKPVAVKVVAKGELFIEVLAQYVQAKLNSSEQLGRYKTVEIRLPNKLLEGGLTIVDSPGIGDNPALNEMVIDYTAEAFAFIYVVNCAMKGGVQEDRLKMLLRKVYGRKALNQQSMFSPESAIFVCNKWDEVAKANQNKVMSHIMKALEVCWPGVNNEQIVRFCASEAIEIYKKNLLTPEFKDLLQKFERLIPYGLENKLFLSVSWLEGLLIKIDNFLIRSLCNLKCDDIDRRERFQTARTVMDKLEKMSEKNFTELKKFVNEKVDEAVNLLSAHLQREDVLKRVATWQQHEFPSSTVKNWQDQRYLICKQLENKVKAVVDEWEKETNFIQNTNPQIEEKFQEWFEGKEVYSKLDEIHNILLDRNKMDVKAVHLTGFSRRQEADLFGKVQDVVSIAYKEHKVKFWLAMPVMVPAAVIAALPAVIAVGVDSLLNIAKQQFYMGHLDNYRRDRATVLYEETCRIVPQYCKSREFRDYVAKLLGDSFNLVDELRQVIPAQVRQERKNIENIEQAHITGNHERRRYAPFRQICHVFRCYIQHYSVLYLSTNNRGVKVISHTDITVDRNAQPITKGWFSEVISASLSSSNEHFMLRRQREKLEATEVQAYILEEKMWMEHKCPHLPKLHFVSVQNDAILHVMTQVGSCSLRSVLSTSQDDVLDTQTRDGSMKVRERIAVLKAYVMQIVEALDYLHSKAYIVGDLSLDTVTVDDNHLVKLTNISVPKKLTLVLKNMLKTTQSFPQILERIRYLPKDIVNELCRRDEAPGSESESDGHGQGQGQGRGQGQGLGHRHGSKDYEYDESSDIYSLGLLLWEMTTGQLAYDEYITESIQNLEDFYQNVLESDRRPTVPNLDVCLNDIYQWFSSMKKCWHPDYTERPKIKEVHELIFKKIESVEDEDTVEFVSDHYM